MQINGLVHNANHLADHEKKPEADPIKLLLIANEESQS